VDFLELLQKPLELDEEWGGYLFVQVDDCSAGFIPVDALVAHLIEVSGVLGLEKVITLVEHDVEFTPSPQWEEAKRLLIAATSSDHQ